MCSRKREHFETITYTHSTTKKETPKKIVAEILHLVCVVWVHALACSSRFFRAFRIHFKTLAMVSYHLALALSHSSDSHTHSYFPFIWHYTYLYRIWILITFGLRQHVPDFGNKFFDFSSLCEKDMTTILVGASTQHLHSANTHTHRERETHHHHREQRQHQKGSSGGWKRRRRRERCAKSGTKISGNSEYYRFKSRHCHPKAATG